MNKPLDNPICSQCGNIIHDIAYKDNTCQSCYRYLVKGNKIHPLPQKGYMMLTREGLPICHICGKAYHNLIHHILQSHQMNVDEYKQEFDIAETTSINSAEYHSQRRNIRTKKLKKIRVR